MRGSDFAELRAFAAIVEHGGFARAAAHLGMSASALSQTLRNLEERLGVRLLNRTTRSVALTEAGRQMLARLTPAMAEIDAAVAQAVEQRQNPSGLLRLNVTRVAALHFLAPLIAPFHHQYPDITLDLNVEERLVDIVAGGFDAGVRLHENWRKIWWRSSWAGRCGCVSLLHRRIWRVTAGRQHRAICIDIAA